MELTRFWGVAENGDVYEVAIRPHLVPEVIRRWPAFGMERLTEAPPGDPEGRIGLADTWAIVPDVEESGDNPNLDAWDIFSQALTVFAAQRLNSYVAVHAAVIEHNGKAIIVPAESEGGKSHLAVAAHEAGAKILTDEYALIDPATGLTRGWTRPVRIKPPVGSYRTVDITVPSEPIPVGLVAFIHHDPTLTGSNPAHDWTPITPAQTVGKLLAHTICARRRTDDSVDAALAVAKMAPGVEGRRGEAAEVVADLLALMDQLDAPKTQPAQAR